MKKILLVCFTIFSLGIFLSVAQQLPDPGFEDWSGAKFDGNIQPKYWHASNVEQSAVGLTFRFNFVTRETGHTGYAACVKDTEVGAAGITEVGPGYISLGQPWQYLEGLNVNGATAGTSGGVNFTGRPDTMAVWIKRTGTNWNKEDFHLLFYSWKGNAQGTKYKAKNGSCTSTTQTNEESDIRQATDGNECGTTTKATQVAEGWIRDRKEYSNWTLMKVPIFYANDEVPTMCNVIFSAGNYPNFRANNGLYAGNAIYVDDVNLIYSSKIQHLYIGGKEWKGFDPNSEEEQTYSVGRTTVVPEVYATRGEGTLTNTKGNTAAFTGRRLSGNEININYGTVDGAPTVITVHAEDGSSTTTYRIKMVQEPSDNPRLSNILVNGEPLAGFNGYVGSYNVALPYGTTDAPVVSYVLAEDGQTATLSPAASNTGTATIVVTAPDGRTRMTYTLNFSVALLSDNTLQSIKVNGTEIPDFNPMLTTYRIELPLGTTTMPIVEAVSAYPAGEQNITYKAPSQIDGGQYQVSVTTPGNPTAKTYKLNLRIVESSNSKLRDLKMGNYLIFNPNSYAYYINLPLGTSALPEITYEQGDEWQTVQIEDGGVNGTTRVIVTAANGDQTIYKIICSTEKSDVSHLNNIYLDGEALEGFSPDTYRYTVNLPTGTTTIPAITYEKGDEYETVQVSEGTINATTRIFVTADDGSTSLYEILFSVVLADVSTLDMISISGEPLAGFSPEVLEYNVSLPQGTTELPQITFTQHDEWQTVTTRQNGINGDYKLTVRSQAGTTSTYVLHLSVATSANTTLAKVYFDGEEYADFNPEVREYDITLAAGISQVPHVTFDKGDATQKTIATQEGTRYSIRVIAENGTSATYVFRFVLQKSENAFLNNIFLDGVPLEGFEKEVLVYNVVLTTGSCPVITVDKDMTQQVTITTPVATGTARIVVTPESGAGNTYIINFTSSVLPQLAAIYADGELLDGYAPTTYDYELTYTDDKPVITFLKADEAQKVTTVTNNTGTRLYVEVNGEEQVYNITYQYQMSDDATLLSIKADGVELTGFSSEELNYTYDLPSDRTIPVITYVRMSDKQYVTAGMTAQYEYSIVVKAENGGQKTYKIHFLTDASDNTVPSSIKLDGVDVLGDFDSDNIINRSIEKGSALPELTYESADKQTVLTAQTGQLGQQLIVLAENGEAATYTINYTEQSETDALLKDIRVYINNEWRSITGFSENTFSYNVSIPWRSTSAPCLWPVAGKPGQTITVTYGGANGETTVHVLAADGQTADYSINFVVAKSNNTKLGSLTIDGDVRDVNETTYVFNVPFGTTETYEVEYEKAESEQKVEYISAPIDGTTKIIVTAENGDKSTYSIRYNISQPVGENIVRSIAYSYVDGSGTSHEGSFVPQKGDNTVNLPYGCKSFTVTSVEKNYDEQAIVFYNGGIRRGATIIASSNRAGEADVTYTVTPKMPEFETTGKLSDLKFNGATVPNFRPDIYNYMVNVTAQPSAANFAYTAYDGKTVTPSAIDVKKKQITFTIEDGETYSVCWYYTNYDKLLDFSGDWVAVSKGVGYKPSSAWKTPADCDDGYTWSIGLIGLNLTYSTGKEVTPGGTNGVMLSTLRGAPMNGSVPGMMTLGAMSLSLTSNGNSTSSVTKNATAGTTFKNTPETFEFLIKPLSTNSISNWKMWLTMSDGTSYRESNYTGDFSRLNTWTPVSVPINYSGVGTVSKFNVMLSSCDQENAKQFGGSTVYESSVIYDQMHFGYNSELTAVTVNGKPTTKSGNTFTYTLAEDELITGLPALKFTGKVHDQMQTVEWLNNGEWIDGELTAKVTNYGENSSDNTVYTIVLKRAAVTTLTYTPAFGKAYTTTPGTGDTVYVNMPFGTKALPDVTFTPANIHQHFAVSKAANTINVTVTAEDGSSKTDVYIFREVKADKATLDAITGASLTPAFAPATTEYTVSGATMPDLSFVRAHDLSDNELHQTVDMCEYTDKVVFTVTSEDGTAQQTYIVHFTPIAETTNGKLSGINRNGAEFTTFAQDTYSYNEHKSENVAFTREFEADAVVETITDDSLSIALTGNESHTYTIIYPTELSSNSNLGEILINGTSYAEFNPIRTDYVYESDEPVDVRFILSEPGQTLTIGMSSYSAAPAVRKAGTARTQVSVFTVVVTAENGTEKTYTFTLRPESSDIASLAGISVNGTPLKDFYPDKLKYTYTIPSASPKLSEPAMPDVTYTLGQESQHVEIDPAVALGGTTILTVTAEDGITVSEYEVTIQAEPSHNVELRNILINGEPVSGFKPTRTNYSMQVFSEEVTVDYTTADPFQTVVVTDTEEGKLLVVTAQDGTSTREYEIEVWRASKSNNANLSDILFNSMSMTEYGVANDIAGLTFSEKVYTYRIPLITGEAIPDISATLQEDAQTVEILSSGYTKTIRVTAEDGIAINDYRLIFVVEQSSNTKLAMLYLNGDSLQTFNPQQRTYNVALPVGVRTVPSVDYDKQESMLQTVVSATADDGMTVTLLVKAEDDTQGTYTIKFSFTLSDADTLSGIYADGVLIDGFKADNYYYSFTLPMGVRALPLMDYEQADQWQQVTVDTIVSAMLTTYRYTVLSESGRKNLYTVIYEIQRSDNDSLSAIILDGKPMQAFVPQQNDYVILIPSTQTDQPVVTYVAGNEWQQTEVVEHEGYTQLVVTAENGHQRVYTLRFEKVKSTNATLITIGIDGVPLSGFDEEKFTYTVTLPYGAQGVPNITFSKAEEAQNVTLNKDGWMVELTVVAEDGLTINKYTITFVEGLSSNASLASLSLDGTPFADFKSDTYEYQLSYAYDADSLPVVDFSLADTTARADSTWTGNVLTIETTAADGTMLEYVIIFTQQLSPICWLNGISIKGKELEGFNSDTLVYEITYPVGTKEEELPSAEDISYEKADAEQTVEIQEQSGMITLLVKAPDGSTRVYVIQQRILLNNNSRLLTILFNGEEYQSFSDSVYYYEYLIFEGELIPLIEALPQDSLAVVDVTVGNIGEETYIFCTAQDGSETVYRILFKYTDVNTADNPTANDCLFKRIPGTDQYLAASIRQGVRIVVFDMYGHKIAESSVPCCSADNMQLVTDAFGGQLLYNVATPTDGAVIEISSAIKTFFYTFYDSKGKKVTSGKMGQVK